MRKTLALVVLFSLTIAGCIEPSPETGEGPGEDTLEAVQARLATDLAQLPCEPDYTHGQTSSVFKEIYHFEEPGVRYGEIDVVDNTDLVVFARYGGGGFDILNVSNPYEPEHVVGFPIEESFSLDIKVSGDGRTLFSGGFGEITIVDISDPYAPEITRTTAFPEVFAETMAQAHMIHLSTIGETEYLFAASQWGHGVLVFEVTGEPGDIDLEYLTLFAPGIGGPLAAHDMMVYHDPVEEKPILWVANGFGGFIAADVSDPADPAIVSYSPELDPYQGYTHTVSVVHYGDKRYAVTSAELGAMALKVYDVTDMATPVLLTTWTIETVPISTQHNTQIMDRWLWKGHYGEGVVLFDLKSEIENLTLPAYNVGLLEPLVDPIQPFAQYLPTQGSTWESVVVNGVHWTTSGGIYGTLNGCFQAPDPELRAYV
jgi:hypothetical protein